MPFYPSVSSERTGSVGWRSGWTMDGLQRQLTDPAAWGRRPVDPGHPPCDERSGLFGRRAGAGVTVGYDTCYRRKKPASTSAAGSGVRMVLSWPCHSTRVGTSLVEANVPTGSGVCGSPGW